MVPASLALTALLAACASHPPAPDWQDNARGAMDRAVGAYLAGDSRAEAQEFDRARSEVARTGRPDLVARAELMRCASHVASLVFEPCEGFERLRADAAPPEVAYAEYLAAHRLGRDDIERLPPAQRAAAAAVAGGAISPGTLQEMADPLSRLIAVAVLFQAGQASPQMIALAVDTASAQGWRRPLLAWLRVQALRAEQAGDRAEVQRLQRRIELVGTGR
ncbi:MAG TPA: hypothetical protein VJ743_00060 [Albitalea sp.]|nr:hypothetical protein [Albitalea sp.]